MATSAIALTVAAQPSNARRLNEPRPQASVGDPNAFSFSLSHRFVPDGQPMVSSPATWKAPAYLAGDRIAAVADGALVIDADSGNLMLTDAAGELIASLPIGADAGQLVYDDVAGRAYIADRHGDRIVIVGVQRDAMTMKLVPITAFATPVEPFGLALSPDRSQLLVTCVADRTLASYGLPASGDNVVEQWRHATAPEPRGVAISPDGKHAMVSSIAAGAIERVELDNRASLPIVLATTAQPPILGGLMNDQDFVGGELIGIARPTPSAKKPAPLPDAGKPFARAAFAVRYIGNQVAVSAYQQETPVQFNSEVNRGSYGGGFGPPIDGHITFIAEQDDARPAPKTSAAILQVSQPQSIAWRADDDTMFIAGYGDDTLVAIAHASAPSAEFDNATQLSKPDGNDACGPQGIAPSQNGTVLVWCGLSRTVVRVSPAPRVGATAQPQSTRGAAQTNLANLSSIGQQPTYRSVFVGPELVASRFSSQQHRGMDLFRRGNDVAISSGGALACAGCHPEGRDDGLTWHIADHTLQTPLLAGRVDGTHPYKWDGTDKTLGDSITSTIKRLGGSGVAAQDRDAIAAYIVALPKPRTSTVDQYAAARGAELFASDDLGCASCHGGDQRTDNHIHEFASSDLPKVDTPSLVGIAASAPYYHDGSAKSLAGLLRGEGNVHGMSDMSSLDDNKVRDLVAYLDTL